MKRRKRTALELQVDRELIEKGKDALKDFDASQEVYVPAKRGDAKPISIRFPNDMLKRLRDMAVQKGVGYQQLIKFYLKQSLQREEKSGMEEWHIFSVSFPLPEEKTFAEKDVNFIGIEQETFRTSGSFMANSQQKGRYDDGS